MIPPRAELDAISDTYFFSQFYIFLTTMSRKANYYYLAWQKTATKRKRKYFENEKNKMDEIKTRFDCEMYFFMLYMYVHTGKIKKRSQVLETITIEARAVENDIIMFCLQL